MAGMRIRDNFFRETLSLPQGQKVGFRKLQNFKQASQSLLFLVNTRTQANYDTKPSSSVLQNPPDLLMANKKNLNKRICLRLDTTARHYKPYADIKEKE